MIKSWFSGIALLSVVGVLVSCQPQGHNPDQMIAAAKALDEQFVTAFNEGDAAAIAGLYWNNPEVVSYPPDQFEAKGWQAIRDAYHAAFPAGPHGTLELLDAHQMVAGEYVIGYGKARMTLTDPEGNPVEMMFRYTDVKTERDGKWVYVLDHASAPMPPPEEVME